MRLGDRVRFTPSPAALCFYSQPAPAPGEEGTVSTVAGLPRGRYSLPGPRGGLVYVAWDTSPLCGVFWADLSRA